VAKITKVDKVPPKPGLTDGGFEVTLEQLQEYEATPDYYIDLEPVDQTWA
jgi:hypothetical protein